MTDAGEKKKWGIMIESDPREDLSEEGILELRQNQWEGGSHEVTAGKSILSRKNSKCQCSEQGTRVTCVRDGKKMHVLDESQWSVKSERRWGWKGEQEFYFQRMDKPLEGLKLLERWV